MFDLFKQPLKGVVKWKLKLEKFLSFLQILYTDHKFLRSSVT